MDGSPSAAAPGRAPDPLARRHRRTAQRKYPGLPAAEAPQDSSWCALMVPMVPMVPVNS